MGTSQEAMDNQIDKNIQKRELEKLRGVFYDHMKNHYSSRKYKEQITLVCGEKCLRPAEMMSGSDELVRGETTCMTQCFHKYYRYLAYSNTLFTYLVANEDQDE